MALLSKDREVERVVPRPSETRSNDVSILTKEVRIIGDVEAKGRVRVEGTVTGDVRARGIEVARTGTVEGDVVALAEDGDKETFVVDGTVQGAVRARHVEVRQGGSILGGIKANQAVVSGRIQGGIQATERLALKATAVVEGDIDARRLALEEGGQVNGSIRIGDRATLKETEDRPESAKEKPKKGDSGPPASAEATQAKGPQVGARASA